MIKDTLQGKWMLHPLHPVVVTLPLGLWPVSLLLDLCSLRGAGSSAEVTGAFYCLALGLAGAAIAVITGLADFMDIKPDKPARKVGYLHLVLNVLGTLFWIGSLAFHWPARNGELLRAPTAAILCSVIGCVLSFAAAYLGARMVYEYGIGVGRFSKYRLREIAAAAGNNVPSEKGNRA